MSIKLDQFAVVGVKEGLFSRVVQVKGLPKKEYSFNELYELIKSQKGKQEDTVLKNALIQVLEKDAVSKKGLIELVMDGSGSAITALVGKEEANFCKDTLNCIRANKFKDTYVLSTLGTTFIRAMIFRNANQFMQMKEAFPSNVMTYEQYGVVRKSWLKHCELIFFAIRKTKIPGRNEILKSICYSCDRLMNAFSQTDTANYKPVEKMLNPFFYNFLSYPSFDNI